MIRLEEYVKDGKTIEVKKLQKMTGLKDAEIDLAIVTARKRGCPVIRCNGNICRAKDEDEFVRALYAEWNTMEHREHRYEQDLTSTIMNKYIKEST